MQTKYGFTTTKARSELMKKIKSVDTKAEVLLRKRLWALGLRYRKNPNNYPGKPDIVFEKAKVAVFVDGEFWHGFNWSKKKKRISSNREYWIKKIERNIARDKKNAKELKKMGFKVIRFWEKEVLTDIDKCVAKVVTIINKGEN